jgi:hypothetical protein
MLAYLHLISKVQPSGASSGGNAKATIASFTSDGLFIGQTPTFLQVVNQLAEEKDSATSEL